MAIGFSLMAIGLLLYFISIGSNALGLQSSFPMSHLMSTYFFGGIGCDVAGAYLVIRH